MQVPISGVKYFECYILFRITENLYDRIELTIMSVTSKVVKSYNNNNNNNLFI